MEIGTFVFVIFTAICAGISALADGRKLVAEMHDVNVSNTVVGMSKAKYWMLLIVSFLALISGISGIVLHEVSPAYPSVTQWKEQRKVLELLRNKFYVNQEVELDGKHFENSTFQNVTLIYRGRKPYELGNSTFIFPVFFKVVDGPQGEGMSFVGLYTDACKGHESSCDIRPINGQIVDEKLNKID